MGGKRRRLEYQADKLEQVLAAYKAPARVQGGTVTPRMIRFHLAPARGTKVSSIANLTEELALSLGASSARVHRRRGQIEIEIPREDPTTVNLETVFDALPAVPHGTAILGMDDEGAPLLLRLASPEVAHALICGTTGSGKTVLARSMALSLARYHSAHDLGMILIDPKCRGYTVLDGLPHLARPIATNAADAMGVLKWLVRLMERRDRDGASSPRMICFIDELADLMLVAGKDVEDLLTRLTQRGRSAGIHIVACTQKPTAAVIGSLVKSNFPARIVGSVVSPEDAKVATGMKQTGAEKLLGRGDFQLILKGATHRFQAAYASSESATKLIDVLRGGRKPFEPQPTSIVDGIKTSNIPEINFIGDIRDRATQLRLLN
jgi:S-DNA-T family DNA segregation ATPase FtsK/SpoIIIE